jgi:hypothetical protein
VAGVPLLPKADLPVAWEKLARCGVTEAVGALGQAHQEAVPVAARPARAGPVGAHAEAHWGRGLPARSGARLRRSPAGHCKCRSTGLAIAATGERTV